MSQEIYFKSLSRAFGISYKEAFHSQEAASDRQASPIYVAASSFNVSIMIFVNDHRLKDNGALHLLQNRLEMAPIWGNLMFSFLNQNEISSIKQLQLSLRCDLFYPLLPDLGHARRVRFLQSLAITFEYWSPATKIQFEDIYDTLQYSLSSLIINLEFKYPFVFSYYGKQMVKINYKNLIRNTAMLAAPLDNASVPDHSAILEAVLRKLEQAIMYEFNTLNVMKECDLYSWKAHSCRQRKNGGIVSMARTSLKSKSIDVRPLCDILFLGSED